MYADAVMSFSALFSCLTHSDDQLEAFVVAYSLVLTVLFL